MWHIMRKVKEKIPKNLKNDPLFWDKMNDNVWSPTIEPEEFEQCWYEFITCFGLSNHKWFSSMYDIRYYWIPAYFRDFPLSGILRTTSICESANSFFGKYLDKHDDLVEFFMHFESAMDSQRRTHDSLCSTDQTSFPQMETKLSIEKHAASVFTANVFEKIQMSIDKGCHRSPISSISVKQNKSIYMIHGVAVMHDSENKSVVCSCKKFVIYGFICSHMFVVFQNLEYSHIPDQYILRRWSKNAFDVPNEDLRGDALYAAAMKDMNQISMNQVYSQLHSIAGLVKGKQNKIYELHGILRRFKDELLHDEDAPTGVDTNEQLFQDYYGISVPDEVSVLPPDPVKTKGSGNRLESIRDKAVREMNKKLRTCRKCGQMARHDSRNCPNQIGS